MAKTQKELEEIKKEYDRLTAKLKELSEDEIKEVVGGNGEINIEVFNNWEILPTIFDSNFDYNKPSQSGGAVYCGNNRTNASKFSPKQ